MIQGVGRESMRPIFIYCFAGLAIVFHGAWGDEKCISFQIYLKLLKIKISDSMKPLCQKSSLVKELFFRKSALSLMLP
jgi:hypothetical protein